MCVIVNVLEWCLATSICKYSYPCPLQRKSILELRKSKYQFWIARRKNSIMMSLIQTTCGFYPLKDFSCKNLSVLVHLNYFVVIGLLLLLTDSWSWENFVSFEYYLVIVFMLLISIILSHYKWYLQAKF